MANGSLIDFETAASHSIIVRATDPNLNTFDKVAHHRRRQRQRSPRHRHLRRPAIPGELHRARSRNLHFRPDSGNSNITVTFQVDAGTLQLDATGALAGKVTGNASSLISVTAPVSAINASSHRRRPDLHHHRRHHRSSPLFIQANDLGNTGFGGPKSSSTSVDLTVIASPFNQWRIDHFDTESLDNPTISGPLGDADKNGIANLLEYGVGADPNNPAEGPGLVEFIQHDVNGTLYPAIRINRLKPDLDPALQITVEVATDNFNWRTSPGDTVAVSSDPYDETRDTVIIRSALPVGGETRQMMRLRFTLAP